MNSKKFILGKEPFIRKADYFENTSMKMWDFIIALIPIVIFAWVKNGILPYFSNEVVVPVTFWQMLYPLVLVITGAFTCTLIEFVYYALIKKENRKIVLSQMHVAAIPGILLGLLMPLAAPVWVLIIGCLVATIIVKLLFGGFGHNIFNPALVGYVFVLTAYYGVINNAGGFPNAIELNILTSSSPGSELIAGVTPLTHFKANLYAPMDDIIAPYDSLFKMFLGFKPGVLGETSTLLCILAGIYLSIRKVIDWKIPLIYVGTVFGLSYLVGISTGHGFDIRYPFYCIITGGLMFGAVFMATEPVTGPKTPNGKTLFAISLGVLTILFRYLSNYPEGVATSILLMNLLVVLLDGVCARIRIQPLFKKRFIVYSIIIIFFILISFFVITKMNNGFREQEIIVTIYNNMIGGQ